MKNLCHYLDLRIQIFYPELINEFSYQGHINTKVVLNSSEKVINKIFFKKALLFAKLLLLYCSAAITFLVELLEYNFGQQVITQTHFPLKNLWSSLFSVSRAKCCKTSSLRLSTQTPNTSTFWSSFPWCIIYACIWLQSLSIARLFAF